MQLVQRLSIKGAFAATELDRLKEAQAAAPAKPVHEILIERGFAKEEHVLAALGEEFGMEVVDLTKVTIEPDVSSPCRSSSSTAAA